MVPPEKELVLDLTGRKDAQGLLEEAKRAGVRKAISRDGFGAVRGAEGVELFSVSEGQGGPGTAAWIEISGSRDVERAVEASGRGHAFVVVQPENWKVIPLENLVAEFHRSGRRIYAYLKTKADMEVSLSVLERGVDGIVAPPEGLEAAVSILSALGKERRYTLPVAKVTRVLDVGNGERACIDTASQLAVGEGLLVGSRANFFFLVHSETVSSDYIPAREFRVNAGAIHSYVLAEDDRTRYLSELRSSDKVRTVSSDGRSRQVVVGRVKIERRPLVMIEAEVGGEVGSVMLQEAETIRLIRSDGTPVSVTEIKVGDEVLVHVTQSKARHFGGEVDEFVLER